MGIGTKQERMLPYAKMTVYICKFICKHTHKKIWLVKLTIV